MGLHDVAGHRDDHWLDHRNTVPHWRDFLEKRIVVDTVEVSAPWDRIDSDLHRRHRGAVAKCPTS